MASLTQISTISSFPGLTGVHDTLTSCRPAQNSGTPVVVPSPDHNILRLDSS